VDQREKLAVCGYGKGYDNCENWLSGIRSDQFHDTVRKEETDTEEGSLKDKVNGYCYTIRSYGSQCYDIASRYKVNRLGE
jgi:hypothetical protein